MKKSHIFLMTTVLLISYFALSGNANATALTSDKHFAHKQKYHWISEFNRKQFNRIAIPDALVNGAERNFPHPAKSPEGTVKVQYIADLKSIFPNPERGWHNRRDIDGRGGDDDRDFSDVRAAGFTLLHSYLRLDDFRNTDTIPQSYLDQLQQALNTVRANGLKIILRPVHVWSDVPSVPEERILKHIEQINKVISNNADVICHLEAGYLGKWGEWHSGRYTELSSQSDGETRYRIIKRILDTTPEKIPSFKTSNPGIFSSEL
jgi:hypothetical protein